MHEKQGNCTLFNQIKLGSREAFDEFYEQYSSFVFRIAVSILKNKSEAEDLCHDIFIDVFQRPDEYQEEKVVSKLGSLLKRGVDAWIT